MRSARAYVQAERSLQEEFLWRLKGYPVLPLITPNGLWIPARTDDERLIRARIINRMKTSGMLLNGAPDMILLWQGGAALVETKRPGFKDIFGYHPPGTASEDQQEFARRAERLGIRHAYCSSWEQLADCLLDWGVESRTVKTQRP
jgi:hypothetical protein